MIVSKTNNNNSVWVILKKKHLSNLNKCPKELLEINGKADVLTIFIEENCSIISALKFLKGKKLLINLSNNL